MNAMMESSFETPAVTTRMQNRESTAMAAVRRSSNAVEVRQQFPQRPRKTVAHHGISLLSRRRRGPGKRQGGKRCIGTGNVRNVFEFARATALNDRDHNHRQRFLGQKLADLTVVVIVVRVMVAMRRMPGIVVAVMVILATAMPRFALRGVREHRPIVAVVVSQMQTGTHTGRQISGQRQQDGEATTLEHEWVWEQQSD